MKTPLSVIVPTVKPALSSEDPAFQHGGRPTKPSGRTDGIIRDKLHSIELGGLP